MSLIPQTNPELKSMGERVFETSVRVRYKETDQMGVVHHTNYIVWFEVGRTDLLRRLGLSYRDLEARGILLPVVDLSCRYAEAARYDDEIRVLTRIAALNPGKIVFSYEIRRKSDDVRLARGTTTHLWVNREMKRMNIRRTYPELYEMLTAVRQGEGAGTCSGSSSCS
jgi:acyl-CoA thioester hydrolase